MAKQKAERVTTIEQPQKYHSFTHISSRIRAADPVNQCLESIHIFKFELICFRHFKTI